VQKGGQADGTTTDRLLDAEAVEVGRSVLRALRYATQRVQMLPPSLLSLQLLSSIRAEQCELDAALVQMVMQWDDAESEKPDKK